MFSFKEKLMYQVCIYILALMLLLIFPMESWDNAAHHAHLKQILYI